VKGIPRPAKRSPPSPKTQTKAIVRILEDFIQRGGEASGRPQEGLGAYWRWVVCAYGPALLEALGTFRFLMTELVPLHLILETRGAPSEVATAEEGKEAPPARLPPPPPPAPRWGGDEIPF